MASASTSLSRASVAAPRPAVGSRRVSLRFSQVARPCIVRAEKESTTAAADAEDDVTKMEAMLKSKRNVKKSKKPKVIAPAVQEAYGDGPASPTSQFETTILQLLIIIFTAIIAEGVFIGASGFFPEEIDAFATNVVYPAFSPTVVVFLGISSFYGLFKTGKLPGQSAP